MSQMPPPPYQPPGGQPPGGYPNPYNPYGAPQQPGGGAPAKGFFGALFDLSFQTFVTPMIVPVVYVLALVGLGVAYLVFVVAGFAQSVLAGLGILVFGALALLVYVALIRMALEFYVAITRMSQDINRRLPQS